VYKNFSRKILFFKSRRHRITDVSDLLDLSLDLMHYWHHLKRQIIHERVGKR